VAHDPRKDHEHLLRHRLADPVVAQRALERDHVGGLNIADRSPTEARHQVAVEAGGIDLGGAPGDRDLDVVDPPALGGLAQRLRAGVDPLVPAARAQVADLAVAGVRLTPGGEGLAALLAGGVAPKDLVTRHGPSRACGRGRSNPETTPRVGGMLGF